MAYLWSLETAVPGHEVPASQVSQLYAVVFRDVLPRGSASLERLIDNARISRRYISLPFEQLVKPRNQEEAARLCNEAARSLARQALSAALARAGLAPDSLDALVVCSSTGYAIPSVDACLVNDLGLSRRVRRYTLTTLGCAGGVGGLTRAAEILAGLGQGARVGLVVVEVPSPMFHPGQVSKKALIASLLFGDGAAAAILGAEPANEPSVRIHAGTSWLHPDSQGVMGFSLAQDFFNVTFSAEIPQLVGRGLRDEVEHFLAAQGMGRDALSFFALHPGGRKVLETIEAALGLGPQQTAASWEVLRHYGNMSSATVLFVLKQVLTSVRPAPGTWGLMAAFGPGFATELALLSA